MEEAFQALEQYDAGKYDPMYDVPELKDFTGRIICVERFDIPDHRFRDVFLYVLQLVDV